MQTIEASVITSINILYRRVLKVRMEAQEMYIGVLISNTSKSRNGVANKMNQGIRVIRQLNSVLWEDK